MSSRRVHLAALATLPTQTLYESDERRPNSGKCKPCSGDSKICNNSWAPIGKSENIISKRNIPSGIFKEALAFTNRVGSMAEEEGHHPDIFLAWGKVKLTIWTHVIGGLSKNDFVLAAQSRCGAPARLGPELREA